MRTALLVSVVLLGLLGLGAYVAGGAPGPKPAGSTTSAVKHVSTLKELETLLAAHPGTVLVDLGATWCGPCRMLAPILEEVAGERSDLAVLTVDVDQSPEIAQALDVRSLPTLVKFRAGRPVARAVGFRPKALLLEWLDASVD